MMTSSFEMSDSFVLFYWRIFLFKVILPSSQLACVDIAPSCNHFRSAWQVEQKLMISV